jgi:hypothetical protein
LQQGLQLHGLQLLMATHRQHLQAVLLQQQQEAVQAVLLQQQQEAVQAVLLQQQQEPQQQRPLKAPKLGQIAEQVVRAVVAAANSC